MTAKVRNSVPEVFCKKRVLKHVSKFTGKHLCQSLLIKKETLAQEFSCEFREIFKNTFFYRTPPMAASVKFLFILLGDMNNSKQIAVLHRTC